VVCCIRMIRSARAISLDYMSDVSPLSTAPSHDERDARIRPAIRQARPDFRPAEPVMDARHSVDALRLSRAKQYSEDIPALQQQLIIMARLRIFRDVQCFPKSPPIIFWNTFRRKRATWCCRLTRRSRFLGFD
jgi:hypothetical protein